MLCGSKAKDPQLPRQIFDTQWSTMVDRSPDGRHFSGRHCTCEPARTPVYDQHHHLADLFQNRESRPWNTSNLFDHLIVSITRRCRSCYFSKGDLAVHGQPGVNIHESTRHTDKSDTQSTTRRHPVAIRGIGQRDAGLLPWQAPHATVTRRCPG